MRERVLKHRIAVLPFRDQTGQPELAEAATQVLVTELFKTGRFVVVERERLEEILTEQQLEGIVTPETLANAGEMLGVSLFLTGSVTHFELRDQAKDVSIPVSLPRVNIPIDLGMRKQTVEVSLDGRVYDATSGRIVFAGSGESSRKEYSAYLRNV